MSNVNRVRYGDQMIIPMPVESATTIEIGDNVCIDGDYLVPISSIADAGDAAACREAGADAWVGVALSASANGETDDVLVQTRGVMMFTQETAAEIHIGDGIEPYSDGGVCDAQTVVEGTTSPIAVCVKTHDDSTKETLGLLAPSKILNIRQELHGD